MACNNCHIIKRGAVVSAAMIADKVAQASEDKTAVQRRSVDSLTRNTVFGQEIFSTKNLTFAPSYNMATPPSYVLGPGDEVIEAVLSRDTVHLAAYASGLLYAATLPCRTEADLLYLLESVRRMFPNRMFRVALSGELPDGLVRSLGRRFRRVGAVRPALPGSVGHKEDSYRYASVIRMCYENR